MFCGKSRLRQPVIEKRLRCGTIRFTPKIICWFAIHSRSSNDKDPPVQPYISESIRILPVWLQTLWHCLPVCAPKTLRLRWSIPGMPI